MSKQILRKTCQSLLVALTSVTLLGCATQSAPLFPNGYSEAAVGPNGYTGDGTTDERIVVPTKEIMRTDSADATSESEAAAPAVERKMIDRTYRIGAGDILRLRSFDDETLSMQVVVRYDGYASFQVIPDVRVQGLSRMEAEEQLTEAYSEFYVDPNLTLSIVETSSKYFNVLGEVQRPGSYPFPRPISLIEAITAAGGMRINQRGGDSFIGGNGQLVKASIIRPSEGGRDILEFDLSDYNEAGHEAAFTEVRPGDTVYVPESQNLVYLLGEVRRPSVYAISQGFTLIKLLAQAGGFEQYTARLRHVIITREINETETEMMTFDIRKNLAAGTDLLLKPGDIIYIPKKKAVNLTEFIQRNTAPATATIDFANSVMGLYQNAYATYYTKDRYDLLYNSGSSSPPIIIQPQADRLFSLPPTN